MHWSGGITTALCEHVLWLLAWLFGFALVLVVLCSGFMVAFAASH